MIDLLSIAETGAPPERTSKRRYVVPPTFKAAYEAYAVELVARGTRPRTQASYLSTVRNFCANCGASGPEGLDALSIGGSSWAATGRRTLRARRGTRG